MHHQQYPYIKEKKLALFHFFSHPLIIKVHKKTDPSYSFEQGRITCVQRTVTPHTETKLRHHPGKGPRHSKNHFYKIMLPSVFQICNPIASHQPIGHFHKIVLSALLSKLRVHSAAFQRQQINWLHIRTYRGAAQWESTDKVGLALTEDISTMSTLNKT